MSEDIVERARAALDGVTEGPWQVQKDADAGINVGYFVAGRGFARADMVGPGTEQGANARFIAAARQLVPDLIAEIERLRADLAFTAADLARAWEMGRDAAIDACADYPRSSPEYSEYIHYDDQITHSQDCIRALTPPADLAEKVKS